MKQQTKEKDQTVPKSQMSLVIINLRHARQQGGMCFFDKSLLNSCRYKEDGESSTINQLKGNTVKLEKGKESRSGVMERLKFLTMEFKMVIGKSEAIHFLIFPLLKYYWCFRKAKPKNK